MPADILGFMAMSFAVIATPGPAVAHVLLSTMLGGQRLASFAILGILGGHCVAMSASFIVTWAAFGDPAILEQARWVAACVLGALGLRLLCHAGWPRDGRPAAGHPPRGRGEGQLGAALTGFMLTLANPMSLAFFVSSAVGFLDPGAPLGPQAALLGLLYLCIAASVHGIYAVVASRIQGATAASLTRTRRLLQLLAALMTLAGAGLVATQAAGLSGGRRGAAPGLRRACACCCPRWPSPSPWTCPGTSTRPPACRPASRRRSTSRRRSGRRCCTRRSAAGRPAPAPPMRGTRRWPPCA